MVYSGVKSQSHAKIPIFSKTKPQSNADLTTAYFFSEHVLISAECFRQSVAKEIIFFFIGVCTGGILFLFNYWMKLKFFKWRHTRCTLGTAEKLILTTLGGQQIICSLERLTVNPSVLRLATCRISTCNPKGLSNTDCYGHDNYVTVEVFEFMCQKYVFHQDRFILVDFDIEGRTFSYIKKKYSNGIKQETSYVQYLQKLFGKCEIFIESTSPLIFAIKECLQPFYVFQICSVMIWFLDQYYLYATTVIILSVGSLVLTIKDAQVHNTKLRKLAHYSCSIVVKRRSIITDNYENYKLDSRNLVPGDIIYLQRGLKMPCDALIIQGTALVDESMMTGECKPVYKSPIYQAEETFCISKHVKHILFGGSIIKDISSDFSALVIRTGFNTMQGSMLRVLIDDTSSTRLNFEHETWKFISFSAFISFCSFIWTIIQGIINDVDRKTFVLRALDTITIAIPPALSIIVSVSTLSASEALHKNSHVRCLAPSRINVAGRASLTVFDKTGTLTEDDEDLLGVLPTTSYVCFAKRENKNVGIEIPDHTVINMSKVYDFENKSIFQKFDANHSSYNFYSEETQSLLSHQCSVQNNATHNIEKTSVIHPDFADSANQEMVLTSDILATLATCHSLSVVDGELVGDSLEYQMLRFTNWQLIQPESPHNSNLESSNKFINASSYICVGQTNFDEIVERDKLPTSVDHDHIDFIRNTENEFSIYKNETTEEFFSKNNVNVSSSVPIEIESTSFRNLSVANSLDYYKPIVHKSHAILKIFEFDSNLRRMSVIVANLRTKEFKLYSKGAPETMIALCKEKTCPKNWRSVLRHHNNQGLRVLAIAEKTLDATSLDSVLSLERDQVERELNFQGLLLYTNMLRKDTSETVKLLNDAGVGIYVATGDSSMTAIAMGIKAGIISKQASVLVSGDINEKNELMWTIQPLNQNENADNSYFRKQSKNLIDLLQGVYISQLTFTITGDAFRNLVQLKQQQINGAYENEKTEFCVQTIKTKRKPVSLFGAFNSFMNGLINHVILKPCSNVKVKNEVTTTSDSSFATTATYQTEKNFLKKKIFSNIEKKFLQKPNENVYKKMDCLEFVLRYFQIFARMKPDDKALLIAELQKLPELPIVAMCGDGANDCSALRRADVGISLSSNEASIAAPFNSDQKSISRVVDVFREGRGALANSIQNFQFIVLYAAIQLCSVILLNIYQIYIGDTQFLYTDLVTVLTLSYLMSWSKTSNVLHRRMPPETLLAWSIIISLLGQVILQVIFQCISLFILLKGKHNRFYTPFIPTDSDTENVFSYENTVIFLISNAQIVSTAFILIFGSRPWKRVSKSVAFLITGTCLAILSLALILNESLFISWLRNFLNLKNLPLEFRILLFSLVVINFFMSLIFEEGIVRFVFRKSEHKKDCYKLIRDVRWFAEEQVMYKES